MIIFLQRIPAKITRENIIDFIEPTLKGGWFKKSGYIKNINILILKDTIQDTLEYHALVTVEPDSVGERVTRLLNRKPIIGKHIAVREYMQRNWHNDPRLTPKHKHYGRIEKRLADRRRGDRLEVVEQFNVKIYGHDRFHRVY